MNRAWLLLLAVGGLASCDDHLIGIPEYAPSACLRDPPLTYENFGRGFMGRHCTGCHSSIIRVDQRNAAPVGVDFDTWDGCVEWADRIEVRALETPDVPMPPAGGPTTQELALLQEWLDCELTPAQQEAGK